MCVCVWVCVFGVSQNNNPSYTFKCKKKMLEPCEIYRRMCYVHGEELFSKKKIINGRNMGLPLRVRVEKTVNGLVTNWLSSKI